MLELIHCLIIIIIIIVNMMMVTLFNLFHL